MDGRPAIFAIADPVKTSTPEALAGLKAEGIRVVMLTGDNWTTAKAVARRLGIEDVEAEVLPDQKSAVVQRYKASGTGRGDGRRRRERRPRSGCRRCRDRDGDRHRCRDGKRRRDAAERRPDRNCPRAPAVSGHDAQYPTEPRSLPSSTMRSASRSRPACSIRFSGFCSLQLSPRRRWRSRRSASSPMPSACDPSSFNMLAPFATACDVHRQIRPATSSSSSASSAVR